MFDFDELEEVDPCEGEIVTDERRGDHCWSDVSLWLVVVVDT